MFQIGREGTAGTAVPATVVFRGPVEDISDDSPVIFPEEQTGTLYPLERSYQPFQAASVKQPVQEATWEQFPHILEAGIDAETPTQDGAGTGYIRVYELHAANTPKTYTIETGDSIDVAEMQYSFVQKFTLSGQLNEAVKFSADWVGRQRTDTSFTSLTAPSVEDMLFNTGKIYINDVSSGFGGTVRTGIWRSFSLDVETGLVPVFTGDGTLYFVGLKTVAKRATLSLVLEHATYTPTERTAWAARTTRAVRLEFTGSALATTGTTYSTNKLLIDACGTYQSFSALGSAGDGDNIITAVLNLRYNSTLTQMLKFTHVVDIDAL